MGLVKPTDCNVGQAVRDRARSCRGELESHTGVIHAGMTRSFVLAVIPRPLPIKPDALTHALTFAVAGRARLRSPVFTGLLHVLCLALDALPRAERMRVAAWLLLRGRKRSRDAFVTQWAYYQ